MGGFLDLFGDDPKKKETLDNDVIQNENMLLREEELDIDKERVQTGEVKLSKEIVEEQQTVNVPVTHEEVIIERRAVDNEFSEELIGDEETITIPVTEEHVEVGKHTVVTGEIVAHKRAVEENQQVTETLKKEEAHVENTGDANIVGEETLNKVD